MSDLRTTLLQSLLHRLAAWRPRGLHPTINLAPTGPCAMLVVAIDDGVSFDCRREFLIRTEDEVLAACQSLDEALVDLAREARGETAWGPEFSAN